MQAGSEGQEGGILLVLATASHWPGRAARGSRIE